MLNMFVASINSSCFCWGRGGGNDNNIETQLRMEQVHDMVEGKPVNVEDIKVRSRTSPWNSGRQLEQGVIVR